MNTGDHFCETLVRDGGFDCPACGRRHGIGLRRLRIGRGAADELPKEVRASGAAHPYLLADPNTWEAAGERAARTLRQAGIPCETHILARRRPAPNEETLGEAAMHMPLSCDAVVGVGGGVVNDICKMIAALRGCPYLYVPTAPSMDGFASATSSMDRGGLKVSLPSAAPAAVLADTGVLAAAPRELILAGYGDMAAKYVSLCEWKLSHIITGEYYCPEIADMVRQALSRTESCIEDALRGDAEAAGTLTEGLILAGLAMQCAGLSRPASGMEHYVSHIRDMRALAFGTPAALHGLQCGAAALEVIRAYERLQNTVPDRARALSHARAFDYGVHAAFLRAFVGPGAQAMIDAEAREGKYDPAKHAARLEAILSHWEELTKEMRALPDPAELAARYARLGFPTLGELGVGGEEAAGLFAAAADIRDKYVLGRLLWDIGEE